MLGIPNETCDVLPMFLSSFRSLIYKLTPVKHTAAYTYEVSPPFQRTKSKIPKLYQPRNNTGSPS